MHRAPAGAPTSPASRRWSRASGGDSRQPGRVGYTWSERFEHNAGIWDGGVLHRRGRIFLDGDAALDHSRTSAHQLAESRATSPDPSASSGSSPRCAASSATGFGLAGRHRPGEMDALKGRPNPDGDRSFGHRPIPAVRPPGCRIGASSWRKVGDLLRRPATASGSTSSVVIGRDVGGQTTRPQLAYHPGAERQTAADSSHRVPRRA